MNFAEFERAHIIFPEVVVRLFQPRRSIESPHKQKIRDVSTVLAEIIVKHLEQRDFSERQSFVSHHKAMLTQSR